MESTHQVITKYIDEAIEKSVGKSATMAADEAVNKYYAKAQVENKQHMTDLKTFFSIELSKVVEIAGARPTEERVREIILEESR